MKRLLSILYIIGFATISAIVIAFLYIQFKGKGPNDWEANAYAGVQLMKHFGSKDTSTHVISYQKDADNNGGIYTLKFTSDNHSGFVQCKYDGWSKLSIISIREANK